MAREGPAGRVPEDKNPRSRESKRAEQEDGEETGVGPEDTLVTVKQFQALEKKVDELIMLQKEIATNVLELNRVRKAQAKKKVTAPKPQPKPKPNPLKFP